MIFFFILFIGLISCTEEVLLEKEEEKVENLAPTSFEIRATNISYNSARIEWDEAKDPEGEEITYFIYVNNILHSKSNTTFLELRDLQETTDHVIKIAARDPELNERLEEVTFTTSKYYHTFKIPLWNEQEGMHIDFRNDYIETADNHLIFIGTFMKKDSKDLNEQELMIFKINFEGEIVWRKIIPSLTIGFFPFNKLKASENGGFIVLTDARIIKFNNEGEVEWIKEIEKATTFYEYRDIVVAPGKGYFVIGNRTKDRSEVVLLKLDNKGEVEWHKFYGETYAQEAYSIVSNGDDTYTFFAYKENSGIPREEMHYTNSAYNPDFWLVTVNSQGELIWENTYGGLNEDEMIMEQLIKTRDNGFAFVGLTHLGYARYRSIYRISKNGELVWKNTNGNGTDLISSVTEAHDGGFYTVGHYDLGSTHHWLKIQKFTADGNLEFEKKYYDFSFLTYGGWIKELSNGQLIMPFAMRNFYRDLLPENIFIVKTKPRGEFDDWFFD